MSDIVRRRRNDLDSDRQRSRSPYRKAQKSKSGDTYRRSKSRSTSRTRNRRSPSPSPRKRRDSRSASPPRRRRRDRSRSSGSSNRGRRRSLAGDSHSPPRRHRRSPLRSRSPPTRKQRHTRTPSRSPAPRFRKPLPSQDVSFRGERSGNGDEPVAPPVEKQKPNFSTTGLLAKESNTVANTKIILKYSEPPEARKPPSTQPWRIYIFKGAETLSTIPLYTQSCWLVGREAAVADLLVEHPSCSKQHAAIQFRHSVKVNEFGDRKNLVRPYLIDLESANGTLLNGEKIAGSRYVEVRDKDVVKFGLSEREYVFMLPPPE
ncbi:SMAD/FHA domain-containing protein [Tothia fuscella]|uniref:SMAD/FHA domain-containing protein n=1 Tax=Tothia fuscella TaxID=1048955 RepID=A0A9P4NQF1_9PEZI|nr:SMAD/FHA domain-containing protein [Tothia fuscella]